MYNKRSAGALLTGCGFGPILALIGGAVRRIAMLIVLAATAVLTACASTGPGAPSAGTSAGTLERIKATKTIALGYRESSVPFSYVGPTKEPMGYSVDLCSRVVDDLRRDLKLPELQAKWVPVGVDTRIRALADGAIDLECGSTTNTLSRQEQVDFSLTTFITGASLVALAGANVSDQLGAIRIAVIPGTTTEQMVKNAMQSMGAGPGAAQLVPVKDHAEGMAAVVARRAEVYATDRAILLGLVTSASDPRHFVLLDRYLSYEPYALMLRRGDPAFRLAVNRTLARLYRSGQVLEIYRRWFGQWGEPSPLTVGMYAVEGLPE
jgi:glutamate/aspartate transport system substrate-binding protein